MSSSVLSTRLVMFDLFQPLKSLFLSTEQHSLTKLNFGVSQLYFLESNSCRSPAPVNRDFIAAAYFLNF